MMGRWIGAIGGAKRRSSLAALRRILSPAERRELELMAPDWRESFAVAATLRNTSEEAILRMVSSALNVPFVSEVLPIDIGMLPQGVTIELLERLAAIPVVRSGMPPAVVCLEPAVLNRIPGVSGEVLIYLAARQVIGAALAQSREMHDARRRGIRAADCDSASALGRRVLGAIVAEAESFGATGCEVDFRDDEPVFRFVTKEGRFASGTIAEPGGNGLRELLCGQSPPRSVTIRLPSGEERSGVTIEPVIAGQLVEAKWGARLEPAKVLDLVASGHLRPAQNDPAHRSGRRRVLVVDDNPTFVRVLERFLERENFETLAARSAEEAERELEGAPANGIAAVISDLYMPGASGMDLLRRVRAGKLSRMPFVLISSAREVEVELESLEAGADAFIRKSDDPRLLCAHLRRLIALTTAVDEGAEQVPSGTAAG